MKILQISFCTKKFKLSMALKSYGNFEYFLKCQIPERSCSNICKLYYGHKHNQK